MRALAEEKLLDVEAKIRDLQRIEAMLGRLVQTCQSEEASDACQFFWECPACHAVVRPEEGDCCVYCSYADVPCPPVQRQADDGHAACCSS